MALVLFSIILVAKYVISFAQKYKCSIREKVQADKPAIYNDEAMDDEDDHESSKAHDGDYFYHFLGYDPAVLAQLSPGVLDTLGCVLTRRRGMSVSLVDNIIESVSRKTSFLSKQKELLSIQRSVFCRCKRVFIAHAKNGKAYLEITGGYYIGQLHA
jgi:hypothetical protein